jgi:hypothetical protein
MNGEAEPLARAHIKPGTKFYHGTGHHHFHDGHDLHLPAKVVEQLVEDGLLDPEPPAAAESAAEPQTEALPTQEAAPQSEAAPTEGEQQA